MQPSSRQLRLFLALADSGSVSAAARAMHVTQPTASMQLRELGAAIGMPLYEFVSRRVRLTPLGEELAQTARRMQSEWESFRQIVDATRGLERGRLAISVVSTAKYFIPRWLGSFCAEHPGIDVAMQVLNRDGVVQRLRANLDDLYVMSQPPADIELEDRVFLPNPLVVIAAAGHPLCAVRKPAWESLGRETFILREQGSGTRMACDAHFRQTGVTPRVRLELGSNEAIKQAVAGGLGLAIVSAHALGSHVGEDGLAVLPVRGFPIHAQWHLVQPRSRRLSPLAAVFREHVLRQAGLAGTPASGGGRRR